MSLLKVPLILTDSVLLQYTTTPPHHDAESRVSGDVKHALLLGFMKMIVLHKWISGILEISLITIDNSAILLHFVNTYFPGLEGILQDASRLHVTPLYLLGWILVVTGIIIRAICFHQLGQQFIFKVAITKNHSLQTDGIYSVVRHPAYAGVVMAAIGYLLCHLSEGSMWSIYGTQWWISLLFILECGFSAVAVIIVFVRIFREDRMLRAKFAEEWETYAKRTPYRLFPYVY